MKILAVEEWRSGRQVDMKFFDRDSVHYKNLSFFGEWIEDIEYLLRQFPNKQDTFLSGAMKIGSVGLFFVKRFAVFNPGDHLIKVDRMTGTFILSLIELLKIEEDESVPTDFGGPHGDQPNAWFTRWRIKEGIYFYGRRTNGYGPNIGTSWHSFYHTNGIDVLDLVKGLWEVGGYG